MRPSNEYKAEVIRRQYFVVLAFLFLYLSALILIEYLIDPSDSVNSGGVLQIYLTVLLISVPPLAVLSFFNRRFFGRVVATLYEDGMEIGGETFIPYETIERMEFVPTLPQGRYGTHRKLAEPCRVYVTTQNGRFTVNYAPAYLMFRVRKRAPHVKIGLARTETVRLAVGLIVILVAFSVINLSNKGK